MIRTKQLEAMKPGEWLSDDATRGGGRFTARKLVGGAVTFYFRYSLPDGSRDLLKIGEWSERGDGYFLLTLEQARSKALKLRERYLAGEKDLRGAIRAQEEQAARATAAEREREVRDLELRQRRAELNLGGLLIAYVGVLVATGKISATSVEQALYRHIREPFPSIWNLPIDDVDEDALSPVLDRLTGAGKLREAAKLRSYLRAAFSAAVKSRKAGGSLPLRRFNVRVNPLRDMPTIDGARGVRERALSVDELRAYWRRIKQMPGAGGALLRVHLLTGGQRVAQLARLTDRDVDGEAFVLEDPKGRRERARRHLVPLIPSAADALKELVGSGPYLFSTTDGQEAASYDVLANLVRGVARNMVAAEEATEFFTPGDIRRTVETRLAALGVSSEIRAHLQSHGLSGVQLRHYNQYDYVKEKRDALVRLFNLMEGKGRGEGAVVGFTRSTR